MSYFPTSSKNENLTNIFFSFADFENNVWGGNRNNFSSGSSGMNMRSGGGMDMKGGGGNFRNTGGDNWNSNAGMHCIHMRGLPFRATEQDIADVR